ncbi:MAG TPA: maleylpyruvate isomerase family mycothiol-dependent enzyme [Microthrixaceae bacterium]|nr:maleylpyruvate isomerase family mycothiol-dependent enzyme [Microthrixaceae bacterium]
MTEIWAMTEAERLELADLVEELDDAQLDSPSLCAAWRIRDVVGHVIWTAQATVLGGIGPFLSAGLRPHVMIEREAFRFSDGSGPELASRLRDLADSRQLPPGLKPVGYLADIVVHHQDVRRPLGRPRQVPSERLKPVLDHYLGSNQFTGGRSRTRDLTVVATDMVWSQGYGPEVRGPAEALLMAAVGRSDALGELDGQGVETLASRIRD